MTSLLHAVPKPTPRPTRARKPIQRKARLQAKSLGVSRRPSKTKHARRPRSWGFMAFCHARGCELALDLDSQAILDIVHVCDGRLEFAHLSDRKRYDVGDVGACLCKRAHVGFDGRIGGKDPAYVALSREGQRTIRMRLAIEWMGLKDRDGYGRTWFAGKAIQAHRLAYEVFVGQIPADKELDHTCRNRSCVNASHLEPVSHRENIARAVERRTSCRNGHPWTADNTYVRPDRNARERRACNRACVDRYVARARSAEVRLP